MQEMSNLLAQHGLLLVFANVLLTQVGIPLPAVPMLIVAGAFAAQGLLALPALIAVTVAASLLGDTPWYFAGRRYGYRILRTLCRVSLEPDSCVKQTENIFERWGAPSLSVAKFIPGFSTVAPPLAGTMRLGFREFILYSAVGALLWAALPIAAGMFFQTEVEWVLTRLEDMGTSALLLIAALIAAYIGIKLVERYLLIRFLRTVRIGVQELRQMMAQGGVTVILDVRSASARKFDPRRIPGAIAVDMIAPELHLALVPPDQDVVVYCN
jgi:membrane protein DedA with SNARE-associated domain